MFAIGFDDGQVRVYKTDDATEVFSFELSGPITLLDWKNDPEQDCKFEHLY